MDRLLSKIDSDRGWETRDSLFTGRSNPFSICLLSLLIAASFFFAGCAGAAGDRHDPGEIADLADKLTHINPALSDGSVERHMPVIRRGQRKDALVLVAPIAVRIPLAGLSGKMTLQGLAAPVFNIGDGVQMKLYLRRDGMLRLIGSRYFDPGRRAEDRNWIPISIPLDLAGNDQLEIDVSAGPQGNLTADWLALSSLRLEKLASKP